MVSQKGGKMHLRRKFVIGIVSLIFVMSLFAGYQNAFASSADPVVETAWLSDHLNKSDISIVFVDNWPSTKEAFNAKHIPGSEFVDIGSLMGTLGNGATPPDKAKFQAMMSKLGIKNGDHVILYGADGKNPFTLSLFWLMEYFGHKDVSYLNGGLQKWNSEHRKSTSEAPQAAPTKYKAASPDKSILVDAKYVLGKLNKSNAVLVDARGTDEYTGKVNVGQSKRVGHIPGALDLGYYKTNFNTSNGTLKSAAELKAAYESKGVTKDKEVIVYCHGGVKAANAYFVLKHILGYKNVKNYVGSWGEWANRVDFNKYPIVGKVVEQKK